jgi:hypothetical protein
MDTIIANAFRYAGLAPYAWGTNSLSTEVWHVLPEPTVSASGSTPHWYSAGVGSVESSKVDC